ncbi:hypothetical protein EVAR_35932_1 [Eumeta japonica]|uniref:Uncharacterized protein n=1 Tax=Eumeta variegata TaxID=151549 RepID=A0A4C1W6A4_EUMVA|nr:hypothetical protein EVAR_35932_1 [Eumeta japonica]
MKPSLIWVAVVLAVFSVCECKDLIVGTSYNGRLIWQEKAEYNAIPLKKRVKEVFFSDPGQQIIKTGHIVGRTDYRWVLEGSRVAGMNWTAQRETASHCGVSGD